MLTSIVVAGLWLALGTATVAGIVDELKCTFKDGE